MDTILNLATVGLWLGLFGILAWNFARCIRIVPQRTEFIVERLGKYHRTLGAGFKILVPFIDKVAFQRDLKEESMEVPPQEAFTKDNVKVEVDGVIYLSVEDSKMASYGITDYRYAAIQLAQTTTRSVIGTLNLDQTFEDRERINARVVEVLDEVADHWGIKVHRYEVKNIVPPHSVRASMERQMAAERDRRALLQRTEGQKQSMINESEGQKMELINRSEGEMARRVNEAEGKAAEILSIARATAESIEKVGAALMEEGGADAIRLRLSQQYLGKLQGVARPSARVLVPQRLTDMEGLLASVGLDTRTAATRAAALDHERSHLPAGWTPPKPRAVVEAAAAAAKAAVDDMSGPKAVQAAAAAATAAAQQNVPPPDATKVPAQVAPPPRKPVGTASE